LKCVKAISFPPLVVVVVVIEGTFVFAVVVVVAVVSTTSFDFCAVHDFVVVVMVLGVETTENRTVPVVGKVPTSLGDSLNEIER